MSIESTMQSGGAEPKGGGRIKGGDSLETTHTSGVPSIPGLTGGHGINDRNKAPFDKPRSSGGIPVKFFEDVAASPGPLESTLENKNIVR